MTYEVTGRVARITLDRPARSNALTFETPVELARCVEQANLDPDVSVIALAGNGEGFCGGYDLVLGAERQMRFAPESGSWPLRSPLDPEIVAANHAPDAAWDPTVDYAMMKRNVRGFMSLFESDKPVVCKIHGFCVAGGTDLALCADLIVVEDLAKIGYPPARVWGVPTTAMWVHRIGVEKTKRLLFTGDCLSGTEAVEWGLAIEAAPRDALDERFEIILDRICRVPVSQLVMMKLLVNQSLANTGLHTSQILGAFFDGVARHTKEGFAFQQRAAAVGFKEAVKERDAPFGDAGRSTHKG